MNFEGDEEEAKEQEKRIKKERKVHGEGVEEMGGGGKTGEYEQLLKRKDET